MAALLDSPAETQHSLKVALRTSYGPAYMTASSADISAELRRRALADQPKDFRYYEVVEETLGQQFEHHYFVLENEATGEVAVQPFFFVDQDITAGLPPRLRRLLVEPLRRWWPRFLRLRILMVGCSAGEGQLDSAAEWAVKALHEVLDLQSARAGASIILLKDFPSEHRAALSPFSSNGYRRVPSMPGAQLQLDFTSFEDFMQRRLSRVFRKNLRRKFRALRDAAPLEMEVVHDATPFIDEVFPLHLQTYRRSCFRFEELTPDYFCQLGQRMPERVRFFLWRQNGRLIAFNLCILHGDALHDLGIGLDYRVALDLHMYFVTLRDVFEWGLKNGVKRYHTGPLNYDPKLHLRLSLAPQDLYARHRSPLLNPLFKLALRYLQPVRYDRTLRKFSNAAEL